MSLKQLRNKTSRNGFDLSRKNAFTAKAGELLPVLTEEVIPGDKFRIRAQWFSRSQPANSAAYTRCREYFDFFFVPTRLLWRYFPNFVTQMQNDESAFSYLPLENKSVGKVQPYISAGDLNALLYPSDSIDNPRLDLFGNLAWQTSEKLLKYLDYLRFNSGNTDIQDVALNPFPLLAYQKIWYDYYRNSQWQISDPNVFNVDYLSGVSSSSANLITPWHELINNSPTDNPLTLRYCNWNKDLFMGVLPSPQYGETASVHIDGLDATQWASLGNPRVGTHTSVGSGSLLGKYSSKVDKDGRIGIFNSDGSYNTYASYLSGQFRLDGDATFNILALRQAEALQKWREVSLSGNQDYKTQIEKHFGVSVPSGLSNMCQFLGGCTNDFAFGEVVNTNLVENEEGKAYIQGKGIGSGTGYIDFEAKEHGVLMCIYHILPLLDYDTNGASLFTLKTQATDYAIPEFDKIGMQELPGLSLFRGWNYSDILGYVPRYADYKTSVDRVHGDFTDTLKHWVTPLQSVYLQSTLYKKSINYLFFKCNPAILNPIFAVAAYTLKSDEESQTTFGVWNEDQFLINSFFDVKAVRNLDYNGLPY